MKTIIFFDTETTGLPLWNLPSEHLDQPHVTQLAAELCVEETGETLQAMDMIILPDRWTIPQELAELTGISTERALAEGTPARLVVDRFIEMWKDADLRCAHNESFDMRIRRLTPDEVDRNEEQAQARYDELHAEIEAAEREEHDRQFGPSIPFRPDGARVHAKVQARMRADLVGL